MKNIKEDSTSTIFISLASYREPELYDTIMSALDNAKYPNRVHFGVYSQVEDGEHPDLSGIKNLVEEIVPASEARGPGYARAKVMNQFNNQDYFLQIDAHSVFPKNWDVDSLSIYNKIQQETDNKKIIISFWAKPYHIDENGVKRLGEHSDQLAWHVDVPHYTEFVEYNNAYIGGRVEMPAEFDYHESACALGGYILAIGDLVKEVPYDPDISWTGEESMFSLRAYTRGWKIYSPRQILLYHNYERHGNPRVWGDNPAWDLIEITGRIKMYERLSLKIRDIWGISSDKLYQEFMKKHNPNIASKAKMQLNNAILMQKKIKKEEYERRKTKESFEQKQLMFENAEKNLLIKRQRKMEIEEQKRQQKKEIREVVRRRKQV
jgi:hypothetical protein